MVCLLLLLGFTSAFITRMILLRVLRGEFQHKGVAIARSLAANSVVDVLTQNTSRLKKLVENEKKLDADIAYAFIIDSSGNILAHTFNKGFPVDLAKVNNIKGAKAFNIQAIDTQLGFIYDIAVPILSERSLLGQARIGIFQKSIQSTIGTINVVIITTTFFIIIVAILLAYRISSLITKPISKLVKATQSIKKGNFSTKIDVRTKDEVGLLAQAFNEMASHLNMMVEEIKQLTRFKERNRIAFDLHDSCAQDLANVIKRLELCERLFEIDKEQAFKELATLRQNTKTLLNRTRKVIFDLKSPEDIEFDLLNNLTNYIKNYQNQNNINVKLDIPNSINNIPLDKTKSIFYIIIEALTNVRKHAQAKNVCLSLKFNNNELTINIKDDGRGFDINDRKLFTSSYEKMGLMSMRQRTQSLGGRFKITSSFRQGTSISVEIPLKDRKVSKV
jgi:signal transduction histidine kinase